MILFSRPFLILTILAGLLVIIVPEDAHASVLLSDTFSGITISSARWIEHDSGTNVNQNNGLTLTGTDNWHVNGIESQSTFSRSNALTIVTQVTTASASGKAFVPIIYGDWNWQGAGTSAYFVYFQTDNTVTMMYWNNGSLVQTVSAGSFTTSKTYNIKMVLGSSRVDLYIDSGSGYPGSPTASITQGTFTNKKVSAERYSVGATNSISSITVSDSTTPPLSDASGVSVSPGVNQNQISWTNPAEAEFTGTMIRYSTTVYPTSASDGTLLIDQSGTPGASASYTHANLGGGTKYYYSLFAHDASPAYTAGVTASGTPTGAPSNVSNLQSLADDASVSLSWRNASSSSLTGTMIRYSTSGYPTSSTEGTLVIDKSAVSNANDSYTVTGLTNNTQYYFTIFAHDAGPLYSSGATTTATPLPYLLYDNFSASSIDPLVWTTVGGSITQNGGGTMVIGPAASTAWNLSSIASVDTFNREGLVITSRAKLSTLSSGQYAGVIGYGDPDVGVSAGGEAIWMVPYNNSGSNTFHCFYSSGSSNIENIDSHITYSADTYYNIRLTLDDESGGAFEIDSGSGFVSACAVTGGSFPDGKVFFETGSSGITLTLDTVSVISSSGASLDPHITFTNPTATRTITDQFYNFSIPWIQTSSTLAVTASASHLALGGGVKFVLDEGTANARSLTDLTYPYAVNFTGLAKAEHTLKAYALEGDGVTPAAGGPQASLSNIAVGDIIVLIGDSTTAGHAGNQTVGSVVSCAGATYKTTDCRTFEQRDGDNGETWASFHVELAEELAHYYGYPVFIMNEGWGSSNTYHFNNVIATASQFQNRMNDLQPNGWLINQGVNDARCESGGTCLAMPSGSERTSSAFQTRLQTIVNTLKGSYGASNDQIYLARYSYDTGLTSYAAGYLAAIGNVIANNSGMKAGADIYDYISNHLGLLTDVTHPTAAGFTQEARIWAIALMKPVLSVSQAGGAGTPVTISWTDLHTTESTIAGYTLKYGTTPGVYSTTTTLNTGTSVSLSDLQPGTQYYFIIRGYDNDSTLPNVTQFSSEVSLTTASPLPSNGSQNNPPANGPVVGLFGLINQNTSANCFFGFACAAVAQAPVASSATFTRDLAPRDSGSDVKALQQFLISKKYLKVGNDTGYFGQLTYYAILQYQKAVGIAPQTGNFGPKTRAAVITGGMLTVPGANPQALSAAFTKDLEIGMNDAQVKTLQQYLNLKGFTVSVSGPGSSGFETLYFGPATRAALVKFQQQSGITPWSGYFGSKTRAYISARQGSNQ